MAETRNDGALDLLPDMPPLEATKAAEAIKSPETSRGKNRPKRSKDPKTLKPAADRPVTRIAVDLPLAHLDRPFDYLVPERLAAVAQPGVRVRVRFAGQLTDGYVLDRVERSEHQGRLSYLERVVSAEQVLTPEIAGLARAVADRYAGTLADVLRLAIPQRHAATETAKAGGAAKAETKATAAETARGTETPEPVETAAATETAATTTETTETTEPAGRLPGVGGAGPADGLPPRPDPGPWARYPAGPAFLDAVAAGRPARAAWTALPGPTWPEEIARAAVTAASVGRGVVIVVPDARDLARVDEALCRSLDRPRRGYVTLTADLGPAERYRRWLAARAARP